MPQLLRIRPLTYLEGQGRIMVHAGLILAASLWTGTATSAQPTITPATPAATPDTAAASTPQLPPDFRALEIAVENDFASQRDFQQNDLIHRGQVEHALDVVREAGWDVPEREAILKRTLSDNSFLVSELSSQSGRAFMRKIARFPGTYSRLDRLSSVSGGKAAVRKLVKQKGGDEFVQYLATTKGGQNLGGMMTSAQQGVDLNKPTGRIYTVEDLLAELKNVYAEKFQ